MEMKDLLPEEEELMLGREKQQVSTVHHHAQLVGAVLDAKTLASWQAPSPGWYSVFLEDIWRWFSFWWVMQIFPCENSPTKTQEADSMVFCGVNAASQHCSSHLLNIMLCLFLFAPRVRLLWVWNFVLSLSLSLSFSLSLSLSPPPPMK